MLYNTSSQIIFENIQDSNSGAYICNTENEVGFSEKVFYVTVTETPKIGSKFENLTLNAGDKINVTCCSSGVPTPKILWKFNGKVIKESDGIQFDYMMESGDYECFAVNSEGFDSAKIYVEILREPRLIEDISMIESVQEVKEGDSLELICPYENFLEIDWSLNGDPNVFLNPSENSNILEIPSIYSSLTGNISCFVTNLAGNKSFTYQIDVLHAPKIPSTLELSNKISEFMNDELDVEELKFKIGDTLKLNCSAVGNPKPIVSWKKSGDVIALGEVLEIEKLKFHHQDIYTCIAENELGVHKKSFKVEVMSAPIILNKKIQKYFQVSYGESVHLKCKMVGNPLVTLLWFKDG